MTDAQVIAAIRKCHLKANIAKFESDPEFWGHPLWSEAWLDQGGTIFGPGPYLHVPIKGGDFDGTVQRVYAPARLQRRLAKRWQRILTTAIVQGPQAQPQAVPGEPKSRAVAVNKVRSMAARASRRA